MDITINKYTIKRLVKFAYHQKRDEDWVVIRVFEELIREENRHMTETLRNKYLAEYQKFIPFIREQCKLLEAECRKKILLSDMTTATAKGMITEMAEQGLIDLPKNYTVSGTDTGRVTIRFESPGCIIKAPLDHLKGRLIKRFPNNHH